MVGFRDGSVRVLNTADWSQVKVIQVCDAWICDIKFSTDDQYVAFGSHNKHCYIYNAKTGGYSKAHKDLNKSSSAVLHIDWGTAASNKHIIHVNDQAGEILFYDAASGVQNPSGKTAFRDETW